MRSPTVAHVIVPTATSRASVGLGYLPEGDAGVRRTLELMRTLARGGASSARIRKLAAQLIQRAAGAGEDALRVLFEFVRDRIRYQRDPRTLGAVPIVESLATPNSTLDRGAEDCDGKATLLAALIRALRLPVRLAFRAIGADPSRPHAFTHVYLVGYLGPRRIPLDATYAGTAFGWEYPRPSRVMELAL